MSDYLVEIDGKNDLQQITGQIAGEEAGGSEFVSSSISFHEGKVTNLAKFKELPPGTRPKALSLVKQGTAPPANTKVVWSGVMLVTGTNTAVQAYRAV